MLQCTHDLGAGARTARSRRIGEFSPDLQPLWLGGGAHNMAGAKKQRGVAKGSDDRGKKSSKPMVQGDIVKNAGYGLRLSIDWGPSVLTERVMPCR